MTIKKVREKAFVPMLETIRRLAMTRIAQRLSKSHDHKGFVHPMLRSFLRKSTKQLLLVWSPTNGYYEAKLGGSPYRVNLDRRTCSYQRFDICGIPSEHAYEMIIAKQMVPEDYVCHWFRTAMWKRNYEEGSIPVRCIRFWPATGAPSVEVLRQPNQLEGHSGSKKVTKADHGKKKGVNEPPTKRIMHCGDCGAANHNSRFPKNDPIVVSIMQDNGESSQGTLTQE